MIVVQQEYKYIYIPLAFYMLCQILIRIDGNVKNLMIINSNNVIDCNDT